MSKLVFPSDYIVLDIETTGLNSRSDEIIEIGAVKIADHQVVDTFSRLIKPQFPISKFITNLTGITNEMVSDADDIETVLTDFLLFINDAILIGHNVNFDLGFIKNNFERHLGICLENQSLDNLRYARKILPQLSSHKLKDCVSYFNIFQETAHRALDDAQATYEVFEHLRHMYEKENGSEADKINLLKECIFEKEMALLNPEVRSNPLLIQNYVDKQFREFTSLGIVYKYEINDTFEGNKNKDWQIENFQIQEIDKKTVLATYVLHKSSQKTLRSSIWIKTKQDWKMIFHQGTLTA